MKRILFLLMIFGMGLTSISRLYAQSLAVGAPVLDDYYRRAQLLGKIDSNASFTIRPLVFNQELKIIDIFDPDVTTNNIRVSFANKRGVFLLLPLSLQQQFNSNHPYGWNDGPMIPARGYQALVSGGFYFRYGVLSIQSKPEYVFAANTPFNGFLSGHSGTDVDKYYIIHQQIDWPERFGDKPYKKGFLGQSSIRLNFNAVSIGISSENLWWGPGIQNTLVLTNNAPGFTHLTINTIKPLKTLLGSFEGQVIAGKLENSGFPALYPVIDYKHDEWRYLSGFNFNYHPKWVPGFTLGFIRTFNAYYSDVKANGFKAYLPFFNSFQKKNTNAGVGDLFPRDQLVSLYSRWVFPKAMAEIYLEYGWEDNLYNLRDFIQSPEHSSAYVFGFRKLLPINGKSNQHISIGTEITQTSQHSELFIREVGLWYANYQLLQGHTHKGQVLGAGIGNGGNIQSLDVSWISGLKRVGIQLDRYEHDADFTEYYMQPINGNNRNWVDFGISLNGAWNFKNFLINTKIQGIKSLNYQWILKDYRPDQYYIPHNNAYNFHGELGVTYRF